MTSHNDSAFEQSVHTFKVNSDFQAAWPCDGECTCWLGGSVGAVRDHWPTKLGHRPSNKKEKWFQPGDHLDSLQL